ncbi:MAG: PorV/PorQ family protein [Cryomorphaceae bacterium]|nr:PorV/PorQ family protein [Cryomorphaceae bacterium]
MVTGETLKGQVARKYANEFLEIGVDARALAMGKSVISSVSGADAGYWNPAGLAGMTTNADASLMHAEYFGSIANFDYAAIALPVDKTSTVGFSFIRFGVDDIMDTSLLQDADGNVDYDRIQRFSAADYAFMFSYATQSEKIEGLSYGANVKMLYRSLGRFAKGYGFGFDLGMQYRSGDWRFGAVARDVTSTFTAWDIRIDDELAEVFQQTGNEMPDNNNEISLPKFIMGVGRIFNFNEDFSLLTEINAGFTFDGERNALVSGASGISMYPSAGLEFGFREFVFLRMGAGEFQRELEFNNQIRTAWMPSMGLGFNYRGLRVSYALTDIGSQGVAMYSNIFSLSATFGGKNTLL